MVATFDGDRVSRVSSGEGISMLPAFGRGGVWYSILTEERMFITRTGVNDRPIIESDGLNMGVSVCGGRVYFSSTRDGNSEIYSANLRGEDVRRLTDHPGIDVSPTCGGPGGKIAFVSTRHGSPQIFSMNANGGGVSRITFRGHHNQTPQWCTGGPRRPAPRVHRPGRQLRRVHGEPPHAGVHPPSRRARAPTRTRPSAPTAGWSRSTPRAAASSSRAPRAWNQNLVIPGHAETLRWSR